MSLPSDALRAAGVLFHPAAAPGDLDALEAHLGIPLPDEVWALYLDHDGEACPPGLYAHLQDLENLRGTLDELTDLLGQPEGEVRFLPLWADADGGHFVYVLQGAARGMIGSLSADDLTYAPPHYRDLGGLYAALLDAFGRDDFDLTRDYDGHRGIGPREATVFDEHLHAYCHAVDNAAREFHAAFVLILCPPGREADLYPLLHDPDVAGPVARLLTGREAPGARDALISAVRGYAHNADLTAQLLDALTTVQAPGTPDALLAVARSYPVTYAARYVADALDRCGVPVQYGSDGVAHVQDGPAWFTLSGWAARPADSGEA